MIKEKFCTARNTLLLKLHDLRNRTILKDICILNKINIINQFKLSKKKELTNFNLKQILYFIDKKNILKFTRFVKYWNKTKNIKIKWIQFFFSSCLLTHSKAVKLLRYEGKRNLGHDMRVTQRRERKILFLR